MGVGVYVFVSGYRVWSDAGAVTHLGAPAAENGRVKTVDLVR